ncbi:hypothetical protein HCU64_19090 [Methylobacterium sp. C25]|uniref:hypothetical protein n=1 Tax=Methylobacterium sp. C25 TaxID=2721622 RepID=UPI001F46B131|nr:hypothetical protein [Methylobacterium sp. C25]MCE4225862.1 hypothetical protein [Methylobacterium sp. C25]
MGRREVKRACAVGSGQAERPVDLANNFTEQRNTGAVYSLTICNDTMERVMGGELVVFVLAAATFAGYVFGSDVLKADTQH